MCGISGFLSPVGRFDGDTLGSIVTTMSNALQHRGPDGRGIWVDSARGLALGHRRLAIQDLSEAGRQPMVSACGRYVITYNGEVYNFLELRHELRALGHSFRGHSDTEVILAAVREWGLVKTLQRAQGMFAFGLWDRDSHTLTLARDRAGKKPLYYGWCGASLLFGSELKALRHHPDFDARIDRDALGLFLQYSWIPAPHSIYRQIHKLLPGTYLNITAETPPGEGTPRSYWSAREVAERGEARPFSGSLEAAVDELDRLLEDAIKGRMIADVDLGALLSGGIDSSAVVALMQKTSRRPIKTFTIGFEDPEFNEAEHAAAIASHLGTEHTELYVNARQTLEVIPRLPEIYDEPLADASAIPTFIVSQLARSQVTVALSGDGGDELFGGYTRYLSTLRQWDKWKRYPRPLRHGAAAAMAWLAQAGHARSVQPVPPGHTPGRPLFAKLDKKSKRLGARDPLDLFARVSSYCADPTRLVPGARRVPTALSDPRLQPTVHDALQKMMYLDFVGFMVDDILVKVDRASMAVSLELRSPFLDHRIVEFAWSLPLEQRIGPGGGKYVLRKLLERYIPRTLTERPKRGFNVPIAEWLRGPLRPWAEELLDPGRLREQGLLNAGEVRRLWHQHLAGWGNRKNIVWSLLMFQAWLETWGEAGERQPPAAASTGT